MRIESGRAARANADLIASLIGWPSTSPAMALLGKELISVFPTLLPLLTIFYVKRADVSFTLTRDNWDKEYDYVVGKCVMRVSPASDKLFRARRKKFRALPVRKRFQVRDSRRSFPLLAMCSRRRLGRGSGGLASVRESRSHSPAAGSRRLREHHLGHSSRLPVAAIDTDGLAVQDRSSRSSLLWSQRQGMH